MVIDYINVIDAFNLHFVLLLNKGFERGGRGRGRGFGGGDRGRGGEY